MGNLNSSQISLSYQERVDPRWSSLQINDQFDQSQSASISQQIDKLQKHLSFQASKNKFRLQMVKTVPLQSFRLKNNSLGYGNFDDLNKDQNQLRFTRISENKTESYYISSKDLSDGVTMESQQFLKFIKEECVYDYYRKIQRIKKGERGELHKVQELEGRNTKILKIVSKVYFREKTLIKGISEIENLLKLDHPHIIKILQAYEDINRYYIIFQKIQGMNLLEYMMRNTISQQVGKEIVKQLLESLQYIHNCGIIHRNIRLENIMIQQSKNSSPLKLRLIGFGTSLTIQEALKEKADVGSIFFAPPQSFEHKVNTKYDIWSVGILTMILFWSSSPSTFWKRDYLSDLLKRNQTFKQHLKKLPLAVKEFVFQLLTVKNKRRPTATQALKIEWISGIKGLYKSRLPKGADIDQQLSNRT